MPRRQKLVLSYKNAINTWKENVLFGLNVIIGQIKITQNFDGLGQPKVGKNLLTDKRACNRKITIMLSTW